MLPRYNKIVLSNKLISNMKGKLKLRKGERFICCFDSLRYENEIIVELKEYFERFKLDCKKDFLIYSSKDGDDNDLKNERDLEG